MRSQGVLPTVVWRTQHTSYTLILVASEVTPATLDATTDKHSCMLMIRWDSHFLSTYLCVDGSSINIGKCCQVYA